MIIIDLENLSTNQNIIFNRISSEVKFEYDKLINEISSDHIDNIHWIVSSIASRNKYQSPLFIRCAKLFLIKYYYEKENGKIKIYSNDRPLSILLKKHYKNIDVVCNENYLSLIWRVLRPFRQFLNSVLFWQFLECEIAVWVPPRLGA